MIQEHRASQYRRRHRASLGNLTDQDWRRWHDDNGPQPRPIPQPQLREEDECPICHSALLPKGPDGSETAREQHVTECIESHFSSSGPRLTHLPATTATQAAVVASAATPAQARGLTGSVSDLGGFPSPSTTQRRRTTGMVVYHASEKDCIGEDGEGGQECVICFEEFTVGDEMGRLECLCKFHKVCSRRPPLLRLVRLTRSTGMYTSMVGYQRSRILSSAPGWALSEEGRFGCGPRQILGVHRVEPISLDGIGCHGETSKSWIRSIVLHNVGRKAGLPLLSPSSAASWSREASRAGRIKSGDSTI